MGKAEAAKEKFDAEYAKLRELEKRKYSNHNFNILNFRAGKVCFEPSSSWDAVDRKQDG